jgi:hypothetical protein
LSLNAVPWSGSGRLLSVVGGPAKPVSTNATFTPCLVSNTSAIDIACAARTACPAAVVGSCQSWFANVLWPFATCVAGAHCGVRSASTEHSQVVSRGASAIGLERTRSPLPGPGAGRRV